MSYKKDTRHPLTQKTPAHQMFKQLLTEGKPVNEAAKIAQEKTGISLVTGRVIVKSLNKKYSGQYAR